LRMFMHSFDHARTFSYWDHATTFLYNIHHFLILVQPSTRKRRRKHGFLQRLREAPHVIVNRLRKVCALHFHRRAAPSAPSMMKVYLHKLHFGFLLVMSRIFCAVHWILTKDFVILALMSN
jgi:ribosomal protein L34